MITEEIWMKLSTKGRCAATSISWRRGCATEWILLGCTLKPTDRWGKYRGSTWESSSSLQDISPCRSDSLWYSWGECGNWTRATLSRHASPCCWLDRTWGQETVLSLIYSRFGLAEKTLTVHTLVGFWERQDLQPKSHKVWKIRMEVTLIAHLVNVLHVLKARSVLTGLFLADVCLW